MYDTWFFSKNLAPKIIRTVVLDKDCLAFNFINILGLYLVYISLQLFSNFIIFYFFISL